MTGVAGRVFLLRKGGFKLGIEEIYNLFKELGFDNYRHFYNFVKIADNEIFNWTD